MLDKNDSKTLKKTKPKQKRTNMPMEEWIYSRERKSKLIKNIESRT